MSFHLVREVVDGVTSRVPSHPILSRVPRVVFLLFLLAWFLPFHEAFFLEHYCCTYKIVLLASLVL